MEEKDTCEGCSYLKKHLFNTFPEDEYVWVCIKNNKTIEEGEAESYIYPYCPSWCPVLKEQNLKTRGFVGSPETEKEYMENPEIRKVCDSLNKFLQEKNKRYGNSALEPLNIFSKKDTINSLFDRIDDKLSRISNSDELRKNDCVDLMGYLVLLCIDMKWGSFEDLID